MHEAASFDNLDGNFIKVQMGMPQTTRRKWGIPLNVVIVVWRKIEDHSVGPNRPGPQPQSLPRPPCALGASQSLLCHHAFLSCGVLCLLETRPKCGNCKGVLTGCQPQPYYLKLRQPLATTPTQTKQTCFPTRNPARKARSRSRRNGLTQFWDHSDAHACCFSPWPLPKDGLLQESPWACSGPPTALHP